MRLAVAVHDRLQLDREWEARRQAEEAERRQAAAQNYRTAIRRRPASPTAAVTRATRRSQIGYGQRRHARRERRW